MEGQVQHYSAQSKWDALLEFVARQAKSYHDQSVALTTCAEEDLPSEFDGGFVCGQGLAFAQVFEQMKAFDEKVVEFDQSGRGIPLEELV